MNYEKLLTPTQLKCEHEWYQDEHDHLTCEKCMVPEQYVSLYNAFMDGRKSMKEYVYENYTFGDVVYRILLADKLGRDALRTYFNSPDSFQPKSDHINAVRKVIYVIYRRLWQVEL